MGEGTGLSGAGGWRRFWERERDLAKTSQQCSSCSWNFSVCIIGAHLQLCTSVFWSLSQLQLEQRAGVAPLPPFAAASRDNGAEMG